MNQTPEFRLLLLLTHPQPEEQHEVINQFILDNRISWPELLTAIKWHRVTPQAYEGLKQHAELVPIPVMQKLKQSCMRCKKTSLQQTAWMLKIARIFKEHQIRFVAMKGVTLSQLLYSIITMRESCDVDIIIDFKDVERAEELLTNSLGFSRVSPANTATQKQVQHLNRQCKDRGYIHERNNTCLELHWRLSAIENFFNIPFSELFKTAISVNLGDENINVMPEKYLWLYQSVHGSMSSWYRLHWINDIARMLVIYQPDWDALLETSEHYQCKKNLVEAVMLATELYSLSVPRPIKQAFQRSKKQQSQLEWAKQSVQADCAHTVTSAFRRHMYFSPKRIFLKYFLVNLRISPTDFRLFPLSDKMFFLYYWLRPVFRLIRLLKLR